MLSELIAAKLNGGGGGGGDVTPSSIVTATGQMNSSQAAQTLVNIGGTKVFVVTFTYSNSQWRTDKTLQEVYAAFTAEYLVLFVYSTAIAIARVENDGGTTVYRGQTVYNPGGGRLAYNVDMQMINGVGNSVNFTLLDGTIPQTVSGTTATITAAANTVYECGELTSLTVDTFPQTGAWSIVFTSGATPTTTSFPTTILGLEDFAAEANKVYEINVRDNRAVVGSWAVTVHE